MSSVRNITSSTPVPYDLAEKIGVSGVNEILHVLWQSYHNLKSDNSVVITVDSEEDDITQEWFVKIQQIWDSRNRATSLTLNGLTPIHQYADSFMKRGKGKKSPTIDFCFKDWSTTNSYFGAEAKNLYDKNDKTRPKKIEHYVTTGVDNYISGRYGSQSTTSSVIGYVLSGKVSNIVDELKVEIQKGSPVSNLSRAMSIAEPQYSTRHIRICDNKEITLYHLFFSFVA